MLSQENNKPRISDLQENVILVQGEADGVFHAQDVILFYATGPNRFKYDELTKNYHYENNVYANKAYYFLNIGSDNGLRITSGDNLGIGFPIISRYDYLVAHETDQEAINFDRNRLITVIN